MATGKWAREESWQRRQMAFHASEGRVDPGHFRPALCSSSLPAGAETGKLWAPLSQWQVFQRSSCRPLGPLDARELLDGSVLVSMVTFHGHHCRGQ